MKLIKISEPGYEMDFDTEEELKQFLFQRLCSGCKSGSIEYVGVDYVIEPEPPITLDSSLDEMLCSACGCEFMVE